MSDQAKPDIPKRGEAAWKEAKDRIAARNDEARKAGKAERQEREQRQEATREKAERRRMAELLASHSAR